MRTIDYMVVIKLIREELDLIRKEESASILLRGTNYVIARWLESFIERLEKRLKGQQIADPPAADSTSMSLDEGPPYCDASGVVNGKTWYCRYTPDHAGLHSWESAILHGR